VNSNNGGAFAWQDSWDYHLPGEHPASYKGGSIQRLDLKTGAIATLYDHCDGKPLNAPNDLVFDSTGGFWFTCFGWSDGETRRMGALYYARADGSKITRWRHDVVAPNGVGLSPDEKTLYVTNQAVVVVTSGLFMMVRVRTPLFTRNPYLLSDAKWGLTYVAHGLAGVTLVGLVIAHVYFAMRPEKWWITKSMILGWITRRQYLEHHDPTRWIAR
jgi:hypothetical protein